MTHTESHFQAPSGGKIYTQTWTPEGEAKAVIALVHGIGEHSGRYAHMAQWFAERGIAMMALDHIGHGKSEGVQGYIPSYEAVMDVLDVFVEKTKAQFPGLPMIMYGHSLGGNFASNYVLKRKPEIAGVALSAPWFRLAFKPKVTDVVLAKIMNAIYPKFTQDNGLALDGLSRDPEVAKRYEADPFVHGKVGPVIFLGGQEGGEYAIAHGTEYHIPTLLMHGSTDQITSYEASAEVAEKNKDQDHFTWKSWNGLYHELHNEPEKEEVFGYVLDWVEELM